MESGECWRPEAKAVRWQALWPRPQQRNSMVRVTQLCCRAGEQPLARPPLDTGYCWGAAMVARCSWRHATGHLMPLWPGWILTASCCVSLVPESQSPPGCLTAWAQVTYPCLATRGHKSMRSLFLAFVGRVGSCLLPNSHKHRKRVKY